MYFYRYMYALIWTNKSILETCKNVWDNVRIHNGIIKGFQGVFAHLRTTLIFLGGASPLTTFRLIRQSLGGRPPRGHPPHPLQQNLVEQLQDSIGTSTSRLPYLFKGMQGPTADGTHYCWGRDFVGSRKKLHWAGKNNKSLSCYMIFHDLIWF